MPSSLLGHTHGSCRGASEYEVRHAAGHEPVRCMPIWSCMSGQFRASDSECSVRMPLQLMQLPCDGKGGRQTRSVSRTWNRCHADQMGFANRLLSASGSFLGGRFRCLAAAGCDAATDRMDRKKLSCRCRATHRSCASERTSVQRLTTASCAPRQPMH